MQFYHSKLLNSLAGIKHSFTTKAQGNIAFHVGDTLPDVIHNHIQLADSLGYKHSRLVHMQQIHSANVHILTDEDSFENPQSCDALITNKKNIPLMVMVADCAPILLYDAREKVIAVVHAGRAGAFKNILSNTIHTMQEHFASQSEHIYASIGPSIDGCCYEVGEEIYKETQALALEYAIELREGSYYLHIRKILTQQLLELGLKPSHIEVALECTTCNTQRFYSYRAQAQTGRFAGVLFLN